MLILFLWPYYCILHQLRKWAYSPSYRRHYICHQSSVLANHGQDFQQAGSRITMSRHQLRLQHRHPNTLHLLSRADHIEAANPFSAILTKCTFFFSQLTGGHRLSVCFSLSPEILEIDEELPRKTSQCASWGQQAARLSLFWHKITHHRWQYHNSTGDLAINPEFDSRTWPLKFAPFSPKSSSRQPLLLKPLTISGQINAVSRVPPANGIVISSAAGVLRRWLP